MPSMNGATTIEGSKITPTVNEKPVTTLEQPACFVECLRLNTEGLKVAIVRDEAKIPKYLATLNPKPHSTDETIDNKTDDNPSLQAQTNNLTWHMFMIHQVYGWGPASVSNTGIKQLQSWARRACSSSTDQSFIADDTSVLDEACSVLESKSFSRDEALGSFKTNLVKAEQVETLPRELCYLLKYVDRHEDSRPGVNPWSIRQAMVYQCLDRTSNVRNVSITVRLSDDMQGALSKTLEDETERQSFKRDPCNLHTLLFEQSLGQWRPFINYIDEQLTAISDEVILSHFADDQAYIEKSTGRLRKLMKRLQYLQDQILRIRTMLSLNSKVAARLGVVLPFKEDDSIIVENTTTITDSDLAQRSTNQSTTTTTSMFKIVMDEIIHRHDMLIESASCLHERATIVSTKLHEALQLLNGVRLQHTTESTNQANNSMVHLMQSTSRANEAMAELMERSAQEARTMKILTVVALFYVPSSFAADFLQMGYVSVTSFKPFRLSSTDDLALYFVITIPLILLTFLLGMFLPWLVSGHRSNTSSVKHGRAISWWRSTLCCIR